MWTLVTIFFFDFFLAAGRDAVAATGLSGLLGFAVIGMGGVGAVLAGKWADALGRERVAIGSLVVSGACSLTIGWLIGAPAWIVVSLALVWGFAIVADSAQFSALVTEVAPQHAVGTALTLQTMLGFALTGVSIQLCIAIAEGPGWGPAFAMLAVGPVFGVWAMVRLGKIGKNASTADMR